jgi:hypothetical protein
MKGSLLKMVRHCRKITCALLKLLSRHLRILAGIVIICIGCSDFLIFSNTYLYNNSFVKSNHKDVPEKNIFNILIEMDSGFLLRISN